MSPLSLQNNLTLSILHGAKRGRYAVGAYNWYSL